MLTRFRKANIRSKTRTFVVFKIRAKTLMSATACPAIWKAGFYFEPVQPEVLVPASFNLNVRNSVVRQARAVQTEDVRNPGAEMNQ